MVPTIQPMISFRSNLQENWSTEETIGWEEAWSLRLVPTSKNPDLVAEERANGRITLAVRGPVGSYISVLDEKSVVKSAIVAHRYNASLKI